MKRLLGAAAVLLLTTSCLNLKGTFTANEELVFKHKTIFGNKKKIEVPAGERKAKRIQLLKLSLSLTLMALKRKNYPSLLREQNFHEFKGRLLYQRARLTAL